MTFPNCAGCGSPLPAVATDPRYPDRCPACVARNVNVPPSPGSGSFPGSPTGARFPGWQSGHGTARPVPMITRVRVLDGVLLTLASAGVAGFAWWALVATTKSQFPYAAVIVGVVVGQMALIGARKGGPLPAIVAMLASVAALVVAEYFIQRSLAISELQIDLPLWMGLSSATEIVRETVEAEPTTGLFWAIAGVVAAVSAGSSSRRPLL